MHVFANSVAHMYMYVWGARSHRYSCIEIKVQKVLTIKITSIDYGTNL